MASSAVAGMDAFLLTSSAVAGMDALLTFVAAAFLMASMVVFFSDDVGYARRCACRGGRCPPGLVGKSYFVGKS